MVEGLDRSTMRPLQKESYLCMAKCCDRCGRVWAGSSRPHSLQQGPCDMLVCVGLYWHTAHIGTIRSPMSRICMASPLHSHHQTLPAPPPPRCLSAKDQADLQRCCGSCEQRVQVVNSVINASIKEFQVGCWGQAAGDKQGRREALWSEWRRWGCCRRPRCCYGKEEG